MEKTDAEGLLVATLEHLDLLASRSRPPDHVGHDRTDARPPYNSSTHEPPQEARYAVADTFARAKRTPTPGFHGCLSVQAAIIEVAEMLRRPGWSGYLVGGLSGICSQGLMPTTGGDRRGTSIL